MRDLDFLRDDHHAELKAESLPLLRPREQPRDRSATAGDELGDELLRR